VDTGAAFSLRLEELFGLLFVDVATNTDNRAMGFQLFLRAWFLVVLVAGAPAAEVTTEIKPAIAPPSSWVKPQFFDRQSVLSRPEASIDQHWLLLERQINAATNETFFHYVRQILTVAGVQSGSDLKIDFNPSYQTLTLHWARLWRGTNHLERLDAGKVRVVRQERDLEDQILNGEQTAMLVMDDVRVGDIVDYAYSIKGVNPVFNGKFSTAVDVQLEEPVERLFTRVIWPAQRRFYPRTYGSSTQPVVVTKDNLNYCLWDLRQLPGYHLEDALPVWCDPQPWVQLTEFKTWAEVNQWALALFQNSSPLSPELAQKIGEWKQLAGQEEQVLAVLRFVQDEIRYFGIEIGVSESKPADPATVFTRRFGDCKDKSLLFVTLLRSLGIEAYPVLVNTQARQTIQDWLPAADIFDHCIAAVRLDGQVWWLDPTAGYQRGSLAMHYLPNYGCGLVISPVTTALTAIPQTAGLPLTTTTEYFDLARNSGASDLKVVTVAEGRDADDLRATFASTKRTDIEKNYAHFYAESYPGTKLAAPIEIQDDELENRFQTTEFYTIDKAWVKSDDDGKYRCDFYPFSIAAMNKRPVDTQRQLPLAVDFPQHLILRTEITVPTSWTYDKENKTIVDPAFTFQKQSSRVGNKLVLEYGYQSLSDFVPADRVDEYLENLGKVSKCFGDSFVWR
jgi:transglutaminase-like putative cysteine protease